MGAGTRLRSFFFFNDTATTEIYTLSLHDALPIYKPIFQQMDHRAAYNIPGNYPYADMTPGDHRLVRAAYWAMIEDRKSTRLNSSHANISYAVFCLKKKTYIRSQTPTFLLMLSSMT